MNPAHGVSALDISSCSSLDFGCGGGSFSQSTQEANGFSEDAEDVKAICGALQLAKPRNEPSKPNPKRNTNKSPRTSTARYCTDTHTAGTSLSRHLSCSVAPDFFCGASKASRNRLLEQKGPAAAPGGVALPRPPRKARTGQRGKQNAPFTNPKHRQTCTETYITYRDGGGGGGDYPGGQAHFDTKMSGQACAETTRILPSFGSGS